MPRSSVGGLWLAAATGLLVGSEWRYAYLIGVPPALLVLRVRLLIKEPKIWQAARATKQESMGSFREWLGTPRWRLRAVMGALLAMVGLATFGRVVIAGQDLAADFLKRAGDENWSSKSKIAFGFIQTASDRIRVLFQRGQIARGPCINLVERLAKSRI